MAGKSLDPRIAARVGAVLAECGGNKSEAARRLDLDRGTVLKYSAWSGDEGGDEPPAPAPPPDPIESERGRQERLRNLRQERDLVREIASERNLRSWLEDLFRDIGDRVPPAPRYRPPAAPAGCSVETMLLVLSDWHAYEEIKPERVLGLNRYDAATFSRRVRAVVDGVASIKTRMERGGGWRFPKLVVACNGDFISGSIHELERHADAPNVVMAAYGCGRTLALALRDLSAHFESVEVHCVSGNHGRLPDARRVQQKDPTRSWDTVIYLFAKTALEGTSPGVSFEIPDAYIADVRIGPWRFLQYHGHDIKSQLSIPFYGVERFARNMNALTSLQSDPAHGFILGHFHTEASFPATGGEILMNGSLIGGNEFSLNGLGKMGRPSQMLVGVHDRHGITHRWNVWADGDGGGEGYPEYPWTA